MMGSITYFFLLMAGLSYRMKNMVEEKADFRVKLAGYRSSPFISASVQ